MRITCHVLRFILTAAVFSLPAFAEGWHHVGRATHVDTISSGVELQAGETRVRVVAVGDAVIRIRLAPDGKFFPDRSWAVAKSSDVMVRMDVRQSSEAVELVTPRLVVRIRKSPLLVSFFDRAGNLIEEDYPSLPMGWDGNRVHAWKTMPADEHFYGLGDKAGPLDRRNRSFTMWNTDAFGWQESTDPLYKTIPFFLALRHGVAYGVFFDNTNRSSFDFGKESEAYDSFGAEGGELNYYFFYGPHPKQVIEAYTALIGRTPLPPLWSLGYQQSRWSYPSETRVREIAGLFREKRIPCDVLYLDIDYQDGNRPFTINRKEFPHFEQMIADLGAMGFRIVAITDPHLKKETGYLPYDQGIAGDHFVKNPDGSLFVGRVWPGESVFPEFTLTRTREWWGTLYRDFVSAGIGGFWNDMNEPSIFERADKTMPLETRHRLDDGTTVDHRTIHNVYGALNARATFEGLRLLRPDERPFVLTRAAYAGAQRFAASWTGDNTSSWNHLRLTVPTLLSLGLSGYPFVGADVGGFIGSPPADLLTRWIELGAFTPLFRNHTIKGSADQEPWVHGPEHEAIRRRYIELRYRLMPYIYTSFEETSRTGLPLMRPLLLEYPQDDSLRGDVFSGENTEFFLGPSLLVAPRLFEMIGNYGVRLPQGDWYDYWSGLKVAGGRMVWVDPGLDELPIYVRAGAVVPQQPVVQDTAESPQGPLELRVYPGADCRGSLYLDDGRSYAYMRAESLRVEYSCQVSPGSLQVSVSSRQGTFPPWWREVQIQLFGVEKRPQQVRAGDQTLTGWTYDMATQSLTVRVTDPPSGFHLRLSY